MFKTVAKKYIVFNSSKNQFFEFLVVLGVAEGTNFDIILSKTVLFLRKGRIAKMIVFARKIDDWRRPGRPGNSKSETKNACGI